MRAKLFLLALASTVLLSACGSSERSGGDGSASVSTAAPSSQHYSGEYSQSYSTSRSTPPFGDYPVNNNVTVKTYGCRNDGGPCTNP